MISLLQPQISIQFRKVVEKGRFNLQLLKFCSFRRSFEQWIVSGYFSIYKKEILHHMQLILLFIHSHFKRQDIEIREQRPNSMFPLGWQERHLFYVYLFLSNWTTIHALIRLDKGGYSMFVPHFMLYENNLLKINMLLFDIRC